MSNQKVISAQSRAGDSLELPQSNSRETPEPGRNRAEPGTSPATKRKGKGIVMNNHSSPAGLRYQKKIADMIAKDWEPKTILCIEGWPVHKDNVALVEDALCHILTDIVSRIKCEYSLIRGTTADNPLRAANQYLLKLKKESLKENHTVKIEVRLI